MSRHRWAWVALGMALMAVVVVLVYAVLTSAVKSTQVRDTQLEGTPLGKRLLASSDQIVSCTTPGRSCYERGQRQTAGAILSINEYGLFVVTCADQPGQQTESELRACANRLQAQAHRKH